MRVKFVGNTRTSFTRDENLVRIEEILRHLAKDFLGPTLYDSSDNAENVPLDQRKEVSLEADGWLSRLVQQELSIRRESHRNWLKVVSKEQLALMEEQGLAPEDYIASGKLFFVTTDYSTGDDFQGKEVFLDTSEASWGSRSDGKGTTELVLKNRLALNWLDADQPVKQLTETCLSVMTRLFDNTLFDYGYCCLSEQYDEYNLDQADGGMRAVGLDASKWLPGFYWANYFGTFLCDLIGQDVLMTVPGCCSTSLKSGVLVANVLSPDRWCDLEFIANAHSAMKHIGRDLFFEKGKSPSGTLFAQTT